MATSPPFHTGERAIQAALGLEARLDGLGRRMIRDHLPDQHRAFYAALPSVLLGSVDAAGWPWASILTGAPGFLSSPDPRTLDVAAAPSAGDPLQEAMVEGAPLGMLGIELHSRRRNRVNGRVAELRPGGFTLAVEQTVGNCPQFIHPRRARPAPSGPEAAPEASRALNPASVAWIQRADTFFVATVAPDQQGEPATGADVSHRGGPPGAVQVEDPGTLLIPDYAGNNMFMTLGNLAVYPRAGLLFIDFETGDLLQITGRAEILWHGAGLPGAERAWRLRVERALARRGALPMRWA